MLRLPESEARALLIVRAFEEADVKGALLSPGQRASATDLAGDPSDFAAFASRRAELLFAELERATPVVDRLARAASLSPALPWIVLPAAILGLGSNLLGPDKRINVVANPLAFLVLWNLAIYAVILAGAMWRRKPGGGTAVARVMAPGVGLVSWLAAWPARMRARAERGRGSILAEGSVAFLASWNLTALPLLSARSKRALHLGALVMVLGAVAGMYARGLLFAYEATWESTFLGPDTIRGWFAAIFAPASALTGIVVPDVASIQAPRSASAASWIHLYAATTLLFVVLPRALLALGASLKGRRLARALPVDVGAAYYRRLHTSGRGADVHARVLPYSYTISPSRADALKALLFDVLGTRARVEIGASIPYGEEPPTPEAGDSADEWCVLLFNLTQTPEAEVHGRLLEGLKHWTSAGGHALVLVDAAEWRERVERAPTSERRLEEHRRTWDRIARDSGLKVVHVDLGEPPHPGLLDLVEDALYPARIAEAAG